MRHLRFISNAAQVAAASTRTTAIVRSLRTMRLTVASSLFAGLCLGALLGTASSAGAFGMTGFGGKLGHVTPEDLGGTLAVGAHLEFEQNGSRYHFIPSLMYWKTNHVADLSANADLSYHFLREGVATPYVGAGLGINFFSNELMDQSDAKLGANLFGGVQLPADRFRYFVEGRYTASDISQFAVLGGITFHGLSGR